MLVRSTGRAGLKHGLTSAIRLLSNRVGSKLQSSDVSGHPKLAGRSWNPVALIELIGAAPQEEKVSELNC